MKSLQTVLNWKVLALHSCLNNMNSSRVFTLFSLRLQVRLTLRREHLSPTLWQPMSVSWPETSRSSVRSTQTWWPSRSEPDCWSELSPAQGSTLKVSFSQIPAAADNRLLRLLDLKENSGIFKPGPYFWHEIRSSTHENSLVKVGVLWKIFRFLEIHITEWTGLRRCSL